MIVRFKGSLPAPKGPPSLRILMVDDNPGDVALVCEALADRPHPPRLTAVSNGLEALQALRGELDPGVHGRPDLILLDLEMPQLSGHETLAEIRKDEDLAGIPVVIFSSSEAPDDIERAYALGASAYVKKGFDVDVYLANIQALFEFWARARHLPSA